MERASESGCRADVQQLTAEHTQGRQNNVNVMQMAEVTSKLKVAENRQICTPHEEESCPLNVKMANKNPLIGAIWCVDLFSTTARCF